MDELIVEPLGECFLQFRDSKEIGAVALTLDADSPDRVTLTPARRHRQYVRVLWRCPALQDGLHTVAPGAQTLVSIRFKTEGGAPAWVAFLRKGRGDQSYKLFKDLYLDPSQALAGEEHKVLLDGLSHTDDLFFCVHFAHLAKECVISRPHIEWAPIQRLWANAELSDGHDLRVRGWARHERYPGLPPRVELIVNGSVVVEQLARGKAKATDGAEAPDGVYGFNIGYILAKSAQKPSLELRLKDSSRGIPIELSPAAVDLPPEIVPDEQLLQGAKVIGKIERFIPSAEILGWALCPEQPDAVIDLVLEVNGKPIAYSRTRLLREDVRAVHGGHGYSGFYFELPPNLFVSRTLQSASIKAIGANTNIRFGNQVVGDDPLFVESVTPLDNLRATSSDAAPDRGPVSAIVLNRNCADLLVDLFESADKHEPADSIEWIIIDHNSTDHSEEVCLAAINRGQDVRYIKRNGNFSFSDSNNFGARLAKHDTLLFVNNDIVFGGPFLDKLCAPLADSSIGVVGVSLLDYVENPGWSGQPIIQHLGVFLKPQMTGKHIRPYESRLTPETADDTQGLLRAPAVTGAMFAMRRADFVAVGGFDEEYIYGLEDVDLCFAVKRKLDKQSIIVQDLSVFHHRGFSRKKESDVVVRQRNNNDIFNKRWGAWLRHNAKSQMFSNPGYWTGARPVVGFVVVDGGDSTTAGEYFTALEFGRALQKRMSVHLRFLKEAEWYDLTGIDVLIVMVNRFDIRRATHVSPFLITVNWMRQWFDRWAADDSIHAYDYLFASSQKACDYLEERVGRTVHLLPIASNLDTIVDGEFKVEYASDYCLTGNKVGTVREIEYQLSPREIVGVGAIFGHNWQDTNLASIARGPVAYSALKDVYASTKIVLDDANIATKDWGSCNSRVFDAIAAGCLLVTNGSVGVKELFGDLVPTFDNRESLTDTLNYWIKNDAERKERVAQLNQLLKERHLYGNRAETFESVLSMPRPIRVAIKCAAKYSERQIWGDYHFARSLAASLRKHGLVVRVDCVESWYGALASTDDAVIVLRGRQNYNPSLNQLNLLWLISHPDAVAYGDFEKYDHVYVASTIHADILRQNAQVPVSVLLQCTDTSIFQFDPDRDENETAELPLFVGNSRGVFRQAVRWCVELEADFELYGHGWEQFVADSRLKGHNVPNQILASYYSRAKVVLCDHWEEMKRFGYLSNRAFDVLACGGILAVDHVEGIETILPGGYSVFRSREELGELLKVEWASDRSGRAERAKWVAENHSFDARAKVLSEEIHAAIGLGRGLTH
ncbi:glycosyltransferase [Methylopila sp. M107]|uniref:glycosyltransferase family protein n=1 Tax=Methylopila sp. M107 TaxID=1101190 RepID=UPI00039DB2CF|nr:glycosyltransferase [Methylopila sp. M107]